jgi:hypothetical protein
VRAERQKLVGTETRLIEIRSAMDRLNMRIEDMES